MLQKAWKKRNGFLGLDNILDIESKKCYRIKIR